MTDLDLDRIQGFVVRGYRLPLAGYIFLRIDDPTRAAAWITEITGEVLTAAPWSAKPDSGVNLAFSYAGLAALQVLQRDPGQLPGGVSRWHGGPGRVSWATRATSAPANWEAPAGHPGRPRPGDDLGRG